MRMIVSKTWEKALKTIWLIVAFSFALSFAVMYPFASFEHYYFQLFSRWFTTVGIAPIVIYICLRQIEPFYHSHIALRWRELSRWTFWWQQWRALSLLFISVYSCFVILASLFTGTYPSSPLLIVHAVVLYSVVLVMYCTLHLFVRDGTSITVTMLTFSFLHIIAYWINTEIVGYAMEAFVWSEVQQFAFDGLFCFAIIAWKQRRRFALSFVANGAVAVVALVQVYANDLYEVNDLMMQPLMVAQQLHSFDPLRALLNVLPLWLFILLVASQIRDDSLNRSSFYLIRLREKWKYWVNAFIVRLIVVSGQMVAIYSAIVYCAGGGTWQQIVGLLALTLFLSLLANALVLSFGRTKGVLIALTMPIASVGLQSRFEAAVYLPTKWPFHFQPLWMGAEVVLAYLILVAVSEWRTFGGKA